MPYNTTEELYDELSKIMENGTEEEAKRFLLEHLKEFPEKERGDILAAFVEDAIDQKTAQGEATIAFQKEAIKVLKTLDLEKKALETKDKLLEIKESL